VQNLQSSAPETFGNSAAFQSKFATNFNAKEMSNSKRSTLIEKLALSTWNRVSGSAKKQTAVKQQSKK